MPKENQLTKITTLPDGYVRVIDSAGNSRQILATDLLNAYAQTAGDTFTGNVVISGPAVSVDGAAEWSPELILRGAYDSDATTGVLSAYRHVYLINKVNGDGSYSLDVRDNSWTTMLEVSPSRFTYSGAQADFTGVVNLNGQPAFHARQTTAQTLAAATFTKLTYETEILDRSANYDATASRFTAPVAGLYYFSVAMFWDGAGVAAGERFMLELYVNGVAQARVFDTTVGAAGDAMSQGSTYLNLAANDYVEVYGYTSGGNATNPAAAHLAYFKGLKMA